MKISNFEFRILIVGTATASFSNGLTPPEGQQPEVGNRQSSIHPSEGGAA
jgi:hypothetical protein